MTVLHESEWIGFDLGIWTANLFLLSSKDGARLLDLQQPRVSQGGDSYGEHGTGITRANLLPTAHMEEQSRDMN